MSYQFFAKNPMNQVGILEHERLHSPVNITYLCFQLYMHLITWPTRTTSNQEVFVAWWSRILRVQPTVSKHLKFYQESQTFTCVLGCLFWKYFPVKFTSQTTH